MTLKGILSKKKVLKGGITKLKDRLTLEITDSEELKLHEAKCKNYSQELSEIFDGIFELCEDDEADKYVEEQQIIQENIDEIWLAVNRQKSRLNKSSVSNSKSESSDQESVHLPKLSLPTFSGNVHEWLSFSDLFKASVHNNSHLSDAQKLTYLISSLKNDAARIVQSIAICDSNYSIAWSLLEERFSNHQEQVFAHIKRFMSMPSVQYESASAILSLVDTTTECVRSLEVLEQKVESFADTILVYILLQKLDSSTKLWWERQIKGDKLPKLNELIEFLKNYARTLQASKTATNVRKNVHQRGSSFISSVKNVVKCVMCNETHAIYKCETFKNLSVNERIEVVKKHNLCFNCLSTHSVRSCKSNYSCFKCKKRHNSLLHFERGSNEAIITNAIAESTASGGKEKIPFSLAGAEGREIKNKMEFQTFSSSSAPNMKTVFLSTAFVYIRDIAGNRQKCRALLDNGSMSNFITTECANRLCLEREKTNILISCLNGASLTVKSKFRATVSNGNGSFMRALEFLTVPKITDVTPSKCVNIPFAQWPQNVTLADPQFNRPGKIDLLLGAECFFELLQTGQIQLQNSQLVLQNSVFGYLISGSFDSPNESRVYCGLVCETEDLNKELRKFWELESCEDHPIRSEEEIRCEEHFVKTHTRDKTGRYTVQMPMRDQTICLGDSKQIALGRLNSLWRRISKDPEFLSLYKQFMNEYASLGHMEEVREDCEPEIAYYLPHHGVYRPEKNTTKLRVVFNASSTTTSGVSLNSLQLNGGVIQEDLFSIMIRFRKHVVAFTADIQKMYRMILIDPNQRDLLRILWKNDVDDEVKTYKLCTVTYGTSSAPYLATRTLKQLARDEERDFPLAASIVHTDFYMDDVLSGADDLDTTKKLQCQLIQLLARGGMHLHKWCASEPELFGYIPKCDEQYSFTCPSETKALGVLWNPRGDYFAFKVTVKQETMYTKRAVLSNIARIFDPLGLIGPIVTKAKLFMQRLWLLDIDWNDPLPNEEVEEWNKFLISLQAINRVHVGRCVLPGSTATIEIHGFSDASEKAYGAVIYVKSTVTSGVSYVRLLCSKSRVAPIKSTTIPRLELCAAGLLAQLQKRVLNSLRLEKVKTYLWSDSTIVLAWIRKEPHLLKTFVANRVAAIHELTDRHQWHHVKSEDNPADLISRGMDPETILCDKLWWNGPSFLTQRDFPYDDVIPPFREQAEYSQELKNPDPDIDTKDTVTNLVTLTNASFLDCILDLSNNFNTIIRVLSYIFRFSHNSKHPEEKVTGHLTLEEIARAELFILKAVQGEEFREEIRNLDKGKPVAGQSKLKSLNPFLDDNHVLRVGGRLSNSCLGYSQRHPAILPAKHKVTRKIVDQFHKKYLHVGPQSLLYCVRQVYWPINGRTLCRQSVHECVICFRAKPISAQQLMGSLPSERVNPTCTFNHTGVDFCGPFYIKYKNQRKGVFNKIYVAIFVCFVTRAIHLEVVTDLSTEAFISALKRFFARRGKSAKIFTDNAKNFVGSNAELKRLLNLVKYPDDKLAGYLASECVDWKFIPPRAPNFGGLWEAGVKSFKYHLKRTVGNSKLTYEEFMTITTQIEGMLNSRPITPLSSEVDDFEVLTPGHFLIGRPISAIVEPGLIDKIDNRLSRWQRTTKIVQLIWKQWQRDYLNNLQQRSKWMFEKNNVEVGALVLIKEDNLPICKWLMGRIVTVFPDRDGKIRVVNVQTPRSMFKRSVTKICVLPIEA